MPKPLIAIAGFHHETNTFAPQKTPFEEFVKDDGWPGLVTGEAVIESLEPLNIGMGGFIQAAHEHKWQLAPILWCNAEPFAHVTEDAYERITNMIVDNISNLSASATSPLDGIYLCLHGAMVAEQSNDGEGDLLGRIRSKVGHEIPLVISLDLHANLTPKMFDMSDGITIFRTYPHIDMADTGRRAFQLLRTMIEKSVSNGSVHKPAKAYRQGAFLLPLTAQYTGALPTSAIYDELQSISETDIQSCDFACGFPPADIPHCGPAAIAYADDQKTADNAIDRILDRMNILEADFAQDLMDARTAVSMAKQLTEEQQTSAKPKPVVIADVQDNPGAGGSGDTTDLLSMMVEQDLQNAVLAALWDSEACELASRTGVGKRFSTKLGGKCGPQGVEPYAGEFEVMALSDGKFEGVGPMMKGTLFKLGTMALLQVVHARADVRVIIASERSQCLDRGFLLALGVDPEQQSVIAVKSSVHFRNDFDSIASHILLAACPGANPCDVRQIPYRNLRESIRLPRSS